VSELSSFVFFLCLMSSPTFCLLDAASFIRWSAGVQEQTASVGGAGVNSPRGVPISTFESSKCWKLETSRL
jgi:hypothetical protein